MKIHYTVQFSGVIDVGHEDWDDLKEDYGHDKNHFAMMAVSEETHIFDTNVITITKIED